MAFQVWLLKSEPSSYSIQDLARDRTTAWSGVRNYQARNFIRDAMKPGDKAFFYHSNSPVTGIVGLCEVVSKPYPDETAFDSKSVYFDPQSERASPRWYVVDVAFVCAYSNPFTLQEMRACEALKNMAVLKKGNRLSVTPVGMDEYVCIHKKLGR